MQSKMKFNLGITIFLLILLSGCSSDISLRDGKHDRSDTSNRIFDEWVATTEYANYYIEQEHVTNQDAAVELIEKIESDIMKIMKYSKTKEKIKPSIIIVQSDLIDGQNLEHSYISENSIITTKDFILTDEYLPVLAFLTMELEEYWLAHGIAATLTESEINIESLTKYYTNDGDMGNLGLFNARFFSSVSGDDLEVVKDTAVSLYQYIHETYGKEECLRLLSGTSTLNMKEVKSNWLKSIQVLVPYDYKFEGILKGYQVYQSTGLDIFIKGPYANYDIQMYLDKTHFINSPYRLELFLYHNFLAIEELEKILLEQKSVKLLNLNKMPLYKINWDWSEKCIANYEENIIYLQSDFLFHAQLHEMVHIISSVSEEYTKEDTWMHEGFACYMTTKVNNENSCYFHDLKDLPDSTLEYLYINGIKNNNYDGSVLQNSYGYQEAEAIEKDLVFYYEENDGTFVEPENFNRRLYMDAISYGVLKNSGQEILADKNVNLYPLYESFVSYLVDEYTLDKVIKAVAKSDSLENIFFKDLASLQNDWITSLLSIDKKD